ncbi:MAG: SUMF1/EgtB/PvdO family nonheme iron enzyme [Byssovorax sp.]
MRLASLRLRTVSGLVVPALVALSPAACGGGGDTAVSTAATTGSSRGGAGGEGGASSTTGAGGGTGGQGGAGEVPCDVNGTKGTCLDVADCTGMFEATPGFCPGPANIQCCTPIPAGKCDPLDMPNPNHGLIEAPGEGACLPGMIVVAGFCVDRYEGSLVQANGGEAFSPFFNPGTEDLRAVSILGAIPQGYIDQIQATSACLASGKRLCTDTEWLRACQGPNQTTYPYGDVLQPGVCNDARAVHPAVEYFGSSDPSVFSHLDNACLNQLPDSLDPSGSRMGCETDEGAFDMMGNLHEWTDNPAGSFRGGYYVDTVKNGPGCLYVTTAHDISYWDYSTGFRCCADLP